MTTETALPVSAAPADLANLLVLSQLLKKDEERDARERERCDQAIRQALSESRNRQEHEQLLFWMQHTSASDEDVRKDVKSIRDAVRNLHVFLFVTGLLLGSIAALGMFSLDGINRVNVLHELGIFLGVQFLLILLFLYAALSRKPYPLVVGWVVPVVDWVAQLMPHFLRQVPMRNPLKVITRSTVNVITDSTVSDHWPERSDAGVGL